MTPMLPCLEYERLNVSENEFVPESVIVPVSALVLLAVALVVFDELVSVEFVTLEFVVVVSSISLESVAEFVPVVSPTAETESNPKTFDALLPALVPDSVRSMTVVELAVSSPSVDIDPVAVVELVPLVVVVVPNVFVFPLRPEPVRVSVTVSVTAVFSIGSYSADNTAYNCAHSLERIL